MESLREAAETIDEALTVYRTSTTGWENAVDYFRNSTTHNPSLHKVAEPGIQLRSTRPLPSIFTDQYNNVEYKSFMGLFPQINRAWLTIDSKLFLWAYAPFGSQSVANDFYVFEGLSQIIVTVALVPPRPGVFVDAVKYVIAIATTVEVTLLGVIFSPTGELSLLPSHMSIATDNTIMLKIAATPEGRIFMAGADGALHEFLYDSRPNSNLLDLLSGRPAKRARKIVHGTSKLSSLFFPTALKSLFARSDGIVDLSIDGDALYTLSQDGIIAVYDISSAANCVATVNVKQDAKGVIFSIPSKEREFVSIHAVPPPLSNTVQLIVVTSFGERIYYSVYGASTRLDRSRNQLRTRPKTLRNVSFRPSPDKNIKTTRPCVHIAWCDKGAVVLSDLRENESDRLIAVFPDASLSGLMHPASSRRPTAMKTAEVVFEISLGSIENDSAYQSTNLADTPISTGGGFRAYASNRNAPKRTFAIAEALSDSGGDGTGSESPNFFWVLTSNAMHLYERIQPIRRLKEILSSAGGSHADIEAFFARHGPSEACSLCLDIAIANPNLSTAAAKVFYTYGSEPHVGKQEKVHEIGAMSESSRRQRSAYMSSDHSSSGFDVGRPSLHSTPLPRFSGAHDGMTWHLAKTLHPLWSNRITVDPNPDAYQYLSSSRELISIVRDKLLSVVSFLDKYPPDSMLPDVEASQGDGTQTKEAKFNPRGRDSYVDFRQSSSRALGDDGRKEVQERVFRGLYQLKRTGEARRAEAQSIISLKKLVSRAVEALALLMILADHQTHRLSVSMPPESRKLLSTMRFCDLVVSRDGLILSSAVIEAIFSSYRDGATAVSSVGRMLQERCPSYFGDADIDLHRGLTLLKQAVHSVSTLQNDVRGRQNPTGDYDPRLGLMVSASGPAMAWTTAARMSEEAAKIFKQVPDRIFDIPALCEDFKAVRGELAFIDVALTIGKSAEAKGNEDRAKQSYDCILGTLESFVSQNFSPDDLSKQAESNVEMKEAVMRTVLTAKSEVFLRTLYDFLLQSEVGREEIVKVLSPNLESFLEERQAWDILWRYCARHERYLEAAGVLLNLCESEKEMGLVDRLNQLSCALHSARTALSKGDGRASVLLAEITDFMDVAKVQLRVKEELKRHHPLSADVSEALKNLDNGIMDLTTLFNKYARPYKLFEACLEAFKCGSHRDDTYVKGLWTEIIQRELEISNTPAAIRDRVHKLGREFYPSDVVFPVSFIMEIMERLYYENAELAPWQDVGDWMISTMRNVGVPLCDVIDGYRKMMESSQLVGVSSWSWSDTSAQLHLLKSTERAVAMWNSERKVSSESHQITTLSESDKIQRTITLCKSRLRALSVPEAPRIMERFEAVERQLSLIT